MAPVVRVVRSEVGGFPPGFLAPEGIRPGLDAPMPRTIALVVRGRWRPTPGRTPLGAPSDHDARAIVTGGLWVAGAHRLEPVLRKVHDHDHDRAHAEAVGPAQQPGRRVQDLRVTVIPRPDRP
jgi:hypothetical protein